MEKYAGWLKESRKQAKLSQQELADAADVSSSYISVLECASQRKQDGQLTRIEIDKCDRISIALCKPILEGRAAAGYLPETSENFQALALDVETWSEENRLAAFSKMEKIYNQYKEKELKINRRSRPAQRSAP